MRHTILILLMLLTCMANAQPAISFDEDEYDFGKIQELGGVAQYRFQYTNTGDKPLIITNVKTTCGCTSPAWSKAPVKPSQKGFIDVTFDPRDRTGTFVKAIIVSTNVSDKPIELYISGEVVRRETRLASEFPYTMMDLRLKKKAVFLGRTRSDRVVKTDIEVVNPSEADIVIEPDTINMPDYIVIEPRPQILAPGEKGVIHTEYHCARSGKTSQVKDDAPIYVNAQPFVITFSGIIEGAEPDK